MMLDQHIVIANIYCFGAPRKTFVYTTNNIINNENNQICNLIGSLVKVEFGNKILYGIILSTETIPIINNKVLIQGQLLPITKIKNIKEIIYQNLISEIFLNFLKKMAWYNIIDIERLLENAVPSYWINKKRNIKIINAQYIQQQNQESQIKLNDEQTYIANNIKIKNFAVSLIRGIMGSGKTYIFLEIVKKKIIENVNHQVLIMVPEIALTNNLVDIIYNFVGIKPVIWHSSVSTAKKKIYYENIINGNLKIIISTRSGLLLPYKNLSLIVIDEEHDRSYKQDEIPCYHARDMAILRAKHENIPVILSSATPSIETIVNVINKKYAVFNLKKQFFNKTPPKIELINIFDNKTH